MKGTGSRADMSGPEEECVATAGEVGGGRKGILAGWALSTGEGAGILGSVGKLRKGEGALEIL